MTTKDRFNYLTFSDWNAMYHFITSEGDLYNPFLKKALPSTQKRSLKEETLLHLLLRTVFM